MAGKGSNSMAKGRRGGVNYRVDLDAFERDGGE
jgi:hypothetical protein